MATREQAMAALFALGQGVTWGSPPVGWQFTMRRVKTPDQIVGQMPALCQGEFGSTVEQITRMPAKRTLMAAWFVYHFNGNDDAILATTTNAILDAVDALFDPEIQNGPQTLGGLVPSARVEGEVEQYGGNVDGQVLLVIPIRVILP